MADKDLNPMEQRVYDVSDNDNPSNYNQMAQLWGEHYQTTQDPTKMSRFQTEMEAPINPDIQKLAQRAGGAFGQGETGMSSEDFSNLLYHTGFHESGAVGGQPQMSQGYYNDAGQWVISGPAGSYFQVEPSTLRDLVTARQPGGNNEPGGTNPSRAYWGNKAEGLTGYSAEQLHGMSDEELSGLLQDPNNQMLGAVAAGAKYSKSFKAKRNKPVDDTMAAYNQVEDAFR